MFIKDTNTMLFFDWQIFYERQYYYNKNGVNFDTKIRQICEDCKFGVLFCVEVVIGGGILFSEYIWVIADLKAIC